MGIPQGATGSQTSWQRRGRELPEATPFREAPIVARGAIEEGRRCKVKNPDLPIALAHLLLAEVGGLLIGGGEIGLVHDHMAGSAHPPLRPVPIGVAWLRVLLQIGRMGEEDAQGAVLITRRAPFLLNRESFRSLARGLGPPDR